MTVHVLMPVFNRLKFTQLMINFLRAQNLEEPISIVVIDDGSTDGTAEYLRIQGDIIVLQGNGSLWWGGAIDLGLKYLFTQAHDADWVMMVNNDTSIDKNFIQKLLTLAKRHAPAAVGSAITLQESPYQCLSLGAKIDAWRCRVEDLLDTPLGIHMASLDFFQADALSGRGVIYPLQALKQVQGMRIFWLPHYMADLELSLRVKAAGWQLLVSPSITVQSANEFGNSYKGATWREKLFAVRSPSYLPAQIKFWWSASNLGQRLTIPIRLILFLFFPSIRKRNENRNY